MADNWISDKTTVNGINIHYHRTGGQGPQMVLCHGVTDNGLCWTHLAQELEKNYDLIMYDVRGHGLSDKPETGYTLTELSREMAGFIESLGLEKPGVIGHSMGAMIAVELAAARPDLPQCIILEDPPWKKGEVFLTEKEKNEWLKEMLTLLSDMQKGSIEEAMAFCREENPHWPEPEIRPWARSAQQVSPDAVKQVIANPFKWHEALKNMVLPVLLITGDVERGGIVTPETAREVSSLVRNGKTVHIPGAGHSIRRDRFEEYLEAVRKFLAQHCG
jgi:pimeloyl-ACP methyl ester carboxylesterase